MRGSDEEEERVLGVHDLECLGVTKQTAAPPGTRTSGRLGSVRVPGGLLTASQGERQSGWEATALSADETR